MKRSHSVKPTLESLESREVPTANVYLFGGTLYINDSAAVETNTAVFELDWGRDMIGVSISSYHNGHGSRLFSAFEKNDVQNIQFYGTNGYDYFRNDTDVKLTAFGNGGPDVIYGGENVDRIYGDSGNDKLYGRGGTDYLFGQSDNDTLDGGLGNDHADGGSDQDTVIGNYGNDTLYGGDGNDKVYGGSDHDHMYGGRGNDLLDGYLGNDLMLGEEANDTLIGSGGNDTLYGGDGADDLYGHEGNDGLFGGMGWDWMWGGTGADRFLIRESFSNSSGFNRDDIFDQAGEDVAIKFLNTNSTKSINYTLNVNNNPTTVNLQWRPASWTDAEIQKVDQGLAWLHGLTNNTRLLKDSAMKAIYFERLGSYITKNASDGVNDAADAVANSFAPGIHAWNLGGGAQAFTQPGITASQASIIESVVHEVGHNWDNESPFWNQFRALSGWVARPGTANPGPSQRLSGNGQWFYNSTAIFFRDYGRQDPYEDMATMWEAYYRWQNNQLPQQQVNALQAKLNLIDNLIDNLTT